MAEAPIAIRELEVWGYRSVRHLVLPLRRVNVLTGPNGCGKSNLYNAVVLLARGATGALASAIAEEGGMPSVLWAGAEGKRLARRAPPRRVGLRVSGDDFGYELQCGLPIPAETAFGLDPEVKEERVWLADPAGRHVTLMERDGATARLRGADGSMVRFPLSLDISESVLSQIQEPHLYPELALLRERMHRWRFYHHFRTDTAAPLRQPQVGVRTPVLGHDGADLAAALQTIREIGDDAALAEAVDRAFPGASVQVRSEMTRFQVFLSMPGVLRPLSAAELSDGTLRYLCLVAALLSPRPPALLALNEPETSLHPDLLAPLASLIHRAWSSSQLWITTHSRFLAEEVSRLCGEAPVELRLADGETQLATASPKNVSFG
ncbi:MAG: Split AAA-ATPase protein PA0787 [uncultured Chloroflexi bacterium]|uniref:Split AAA-ATPase protein PA0787 n=1 Tax=uncultured Chloroflexota bacterium TaxID=166587 RepID=A0A6J4J758_9CHLR|nr:MAG: Split AAA-ATPase protein PA0787 [uncultured Chloroflexota bacterium]